jgi:hypothetical protein
MRGLIAAALAGGLYVVGQALLFRLVLVRRRLAVMLLLWGLGIGAYAAAWALLPDDARWLPAPLAASSDWVNWLNGLFVYWGLFAGYYQFVNMADNSVGVRSLIELAGAPPEGFTLPALERYYPYDHMLGHRLERLVRGGFLERRPDGRYQCRPKAARAARLFAALKRLLGTGPGG